MSTKYLKERLAKKIALLQKLEATYEKAIESGVESYSFSSGEGSQTTKNRKLSELKKQIESLESEIEQLVARLKQNGVVSLTLRRRNCHHKGRR